MLLFMIGTTTARDVDILIYNIHDDKTISDIALNMGTHNIDYNIYTKQKLWYSHDYQKNVYWMTQSFNIDWAANSGANELEDFYFNSIYHFYIHGIKCVSLRVQIERLIKRNSNFAYVDLIGLTIQNNINLQYLKPNLCVPNVRLRQGAKKVISKDDYIIIINTVRSFLKIWHNTNYTLDYIQKILPICNKYKIYHDNLKKYNQLIRLYFLQKYCLKNNLLIIGSNDFLHKKFYKKLKLNKIFLLEESYSIYKNKYITHIKIFDTNLLQDINYIIFDMTFHNMISNNNIIMEKIKNISMKNTKVIIHCYNSNIITSLFDKISNITIYDNKKKLITIEKKYVDTDEFKLVVINDIKQYLIHSSFIIPLFIKYNYKLVEYVSFIEHMDRFKIGLNKSETELLKLYITYVFEYNQ